MTLRPAGDQWPTGTRRIAYLRVSPEALIQLLHDIRKGHRLTMKGLPADAGVVAARYDHAYDALALTLESQEFEAVPFGGVARPIDVEFTDETEREKIAALFAADEVAGG